MKKVARLIRRMTTDNPTWGYRKLRPPTFFTTEVWAARGLVTHYTLFVLDLCARRVHVAGSTPHPDQAFYDPGGAASH
jgi:hypothetical protein